MESSEHNGAYISPPICINRLIFSGRLPSYANLCHNLTNLVFVMPSLCFSIHLHKPKEIIKGQKMVNLAVLCPNSTSEPGNVSFCSLKSTWLPYFS